MRHRVLLPAAVALATLLLSVFADRPDLATTLLPAWWIALASRRRCARPVS